MVKIDPKVHINSDSAGKTEGPAKNEKAKPPVFLEGNPTKAPKEANPTETGKPTDGEMRVRDVNQQVMTAIQEASTKDVFDKAPDSIRDELNTHALPNCLDELPNDDSINITDDGKKTYVSQKKDGVSHRAIYNNETGQVIEKTSWQMGSSKNPQTVKYVYNEQGDLQGYRISLREDYYINEGLGNGLDGNVTTYATYDNTGGFAYITVDGRKLSAVVQNGTELWNTTTIENVGSVTNYEKNQDGEYKVMQ